MGVLQLVSLDILPQGLDDAGAGLCVDAQETSKPRVQLKLGWLEEGDKTVIKKKSHPTRPVLKPYSSIGGSSKGSLYNANEITTLQSEVFLLSLCEFRCKNKCGPRKFEHRNRHAIRIAVVMVERLVTAH